jgi:hypothetical protein
LAAGISKTRSTLSRFLAALDQASVEALRTIFLADLVARTLFPYLSLKKFTKTGELKIPFFSSLLQRVSSLSEF